MQVRSIIPSAFVELFMTSIIMCPIASVPYHAMEIPHRYVVVNID